MLVTLINDNPVYMNYLKAFLMSLAVNTSEDICVYLVNCSEEYAENLKKINNRAEVTIINKPMAAISAINLISTFLLEVMYKGYHKVAFTDNDMLVRGRLDGFWEDIEKDTLKVMYRPAQDSKRKFQNGIYGLGNSPKTYEMIKDLERKIKDSTVWYDDQKQLYKRWKKSGVRLIKLEKKYNDHHFEDDSIIWHCKLKHKDSNKTWNKEFGYYLGLAKEAIA